MSDSWYYVEDNDKAGPVDEAILEQLISSKKLGEKSYVWKKGFEDWKRIEDVPELDSYLNVASVNTSENFDEVPFFEEEDLDNSSVVSESIDVSDYLDMDDNKKNISLKEVEEAPPRPLIDWNKILLSAQIFTIKVGFDRKKEDTEYGPFSLDMLKKLFDENRINGKTFIFTPGMLEWIFLADLPIFKKVFEVVPPIIDDVDRRISSRRPFVAKMFFHNNADLFEGICRDISVGGLQILVSLPPVKVGEIVSMNVHPENSEYSFVASAKVVRLLNGGQGFSIRFINLSDEAIKSINSYLERV